MSLLAALATALILAHPPAYMPEGARIGTLYAPHIHLRARVVQGGVTLYTRPWPRALNEGPAHYPDTSLPWQYGTVGIAGHRVTHTHPFRHLDRLRFGDRVYLYTRWGRYVYEIYRKAVVPPTDLRILDGRRRRQIVLTACNPPHFATTRIAVFARLLP